MPLSTRSLVGNKFILEHTKWNRLYTSSQFKQALNERAIDLSSASKEPIMIFSSGGIDSELVCQTFYELNLPFKVAILKYNNDLNAHDIRYALSWLQGKNVEAKIIEIDILDFYYNGIWKYIDDGYISTKIFRYMQLNYFDIAQQYGCRALAGHGGGLELNFDGTLYFKFDVGLLASDEFNRRNGTMHEAFFFDDDRILSSYVDHKLMKAATTYRQEYFSDLRTGYKIKRVIYNMHYNCDPRSKYTSYEKVSDERIAVETMLMDKFKIEPAIITWDDFMLQVHGINKGLSTLNW